MRFITTLIGILILALTLGLVFRIIGAVILAIAGIGAALLLSIPGLVILTIAVVLLLAGGGAVSAIVAAIVGSVIIVSSLPGLAPFLLGILVAVLWLRARDNRLLRKSR